MTSNLLGLTAREIEALLRDRVDRTFRARQVAGWVHQRDATSFSEMTDLPKGLREQLSAEFNLREPRTLEVTRSGDGSAKYLLELRDGATVEAVTMPEGGKATLCLSSQAGCAVGCVFCVTGALGAGRNLAAEEIVGQYRVLRRDLGPEVERVNIVFMGMGEPLLTTKNLGQALVVLYERVSPKRITVSTAGIIPGIEWLASLERRPKLAVSLNAPDQQRRAEIMPITKTYPLERLMDTIRAFPLERGRRITFEYVLIRDFNDAVADARALGRLLHGIPAKVNVIPLNEDREHFPELRQPAPDTVDRFGRTLRDAGLVVTVRWSKGADVAAACGQLKGLRRGPAAAGR
jgi:23S rRNA (adenine2503-C2)-methyltransferase